MRGPRAISAVVALDARAAAGRGSPDAPPDFVLLPGAAAAGAAAGGQLTSLRIVDAHRAEIDLVLGTASLLAIDALLEVANISNAPLLLAIAAPDEPDVRLLLDGAPMAAGSRNVVRLEADAHLAIGILVGAPSRSETGFGAAA